MRNIMIIHLVLSCTNMLAQTLESIRIKGQRTQVQAIAEILADRINQHSPKIIETLREVDSISFTKNYAFMRSKINGGISSKYIEKELKNIGIGKQNLEYQTLFIGMIIKKLIREGSIEEIILFFDNKEDLTDVYIMTNDHQKLGLKEVQLKMAIIKRKEFEENGLILPLAFN